MHQQRTAGVYPAAHAQHAIAALQLAAQQQVTGLKIRLQRRKALGLWRQEVERRRLARRGHVLWRAPP